MRLAPMILPAALVMTACAAAPSPEMSTGMTVVNVSATYRERIMLPPGHVLTVRIEDVSLADAPAQADRPNRGRQPGGRPGPGAGRGQRAAGGPRSPLRRYAGRADIAD